MTPVPARLVRRLEDRGVVRAPRSAPRDLYDLWAPVLAEALTSSAARLLATHTGLGLPEDHMFTTPPTVHD